MSGERANKKIDELISAVNKSTVEQAKTNVRHEISIEENYQQTINLADRIKEAEDAAVKNAPVIAWASKLQSNISKIITGLIVVVAGSYMLTGGTSQGDKAAQVKGESKNDKN